MSLALYRRLLGRRFDALPAKVRELHDMQGTSVWTGRAEVQRGTSLAARLLGLIAGLPPSTPDTPLKVSFTTDGEGERWQREFGPHVFATHQRLGSGVILERIGPSTVSLLPEADAAGLRLVVTRMTVFGVAVPRALTTVVATREYEIDGRYAFEVEAQLPVFGLLVRYSGWLERVA